MFFKDHFSGPTSRTVEFDDHALLGIMFFEFIDAVDITVAAQEEITELFPENRLNAVQNRIVIEALPDRAHNMNLKPRLFLKRLAIHPDLAVFDGAFAVIFYDIKIQRVIKVVHPFMLIAQHIDFPVFFPFVIAGAGAAESVRHLELARLEQFRDHHDAAPGQKIQGDKIPQAFSVF